MSDIQCPKCKSSDRFTAHQMVRMDVIVGSDNEFIEPINGEGKESSSIYDSEDPYGPYTCMACHHEFDVE